MSQLADRGTARSPGITYQQLLDTDTHDVPVTLRHEAPRYLGDEDVPIARYISREYHELEKTWLWSRVWQFACREEHIPAVGDYVVYEITNQSFVVIRTPRGIRAFVNACLHRGRTLKDNDGGCSELRCPYHGFTWDLDGELKHLPAAWDFEHVDAAEFQLPQAKVGVWAGFVFINPDLDAEPLEDYLGSLPEHFDRWQLEDRYVQAHVAKVIEANWKITQEAFCEAYHVAGTHPQALPYLGDTNSQVDVWENFARAITPGGTPSPQLDAAPTEVDMLRAMLDIRVDQDLPIPIAEGKTAREVSAANARERWRPVVGDLVDGWSDAEFIDNIDYTVFPNFHPWGAFNRIVYRFRPLGDDHRRALMEVIFLSPFTGQRPPPAPVHHLSSEAPWTDAPELGLLAKVFEQDTLNMARVHKGLETTRKPGVTLGTYQESKVRWLHHRLGEWVDDAERGAR
jgi:phenylpropionate dioxygenase-like ring-hydroxylating dioxygenase large terminal subunit